MKFFREGGKRKLVSVGAVVFSCIADRAHNLITRKQYKEL